MFSLDTILRVYALQMGNQKTKLGKSSGFVMKTGRVVKVQLFWLNFNRFRAGFTW